jgi:hypothetical protein
VIAGRHVQSTYGKARAESTSLDGKEKRAGCMSRAGCNGTTQVMRLRIACAGESLSCALDDREKQR